MKQEDRDRLIRVDERTSNIWRVIEKVEKHQAEQNGLVLKVVKDVSTNTSWRKATIGIFSAVIAWIITKSSGLW